MDEKWYFRWDFLEKNGVKRSWMVPAGWNEME